MSCFQANSFKNHQKLHWKNILLEVGSYISNIFYGTGMVLAVSMENDAAMDLKDLWVATE